MIGMDSKNVMSGKVIIVLPSKKPGIIDLKDPKKIKPLLITPEMIAKKPIKKPIRKPEHNNFLFIEKPLRYFLPFWFAPKMSVAKPPQNQSEFQKSIMCFA